LAFVLQERREATELAQVRASYDEALALLGAQPADDLLRARRRERLAGPAKGRRCAQGRDQEAQAEDRGAGPGRRHCAGGGKGPPYGPDDVRRVKQAMPNVSERRVCTTMSVPRSAVRGDGSDGTTSSGVRTRRLAISARASTRRHNFNVWLDRGEALHELARPHRPSSFLVGDREPRPYGIAGGAGNGKKATNAWP